MACIYGDHGPKWLGVERSTWTPLAISSASIMVVVGGVFALFHFQMHAPLLFQALTGGVGGAALPFFIASCIGIIKTRRRPEPPQEDAPEADLEVEAGPQPVQIEGAEGALGVGEEDAEDSFERIGRVNAAAPAAPIEGDTVTLQKAQLEPIYTSLGELFAALLKVHDRGEKEEGSKLIRLLFVTIINYIPEEIVLSEEELATLVESLKMRVEQLAGADFDEGLNKRKEEILQQLRESGDNKQKIAAGTLNSFLANTLKKTVVAEMGNDVTQMLLGWLGDFPYFNQLYEAKENLIYPLIETLAEKLAPAIFDLIFINGSKVRKQLIKKTDEINGLAKNMSGKISVENATEALGEIAQQCAAFAKNLAS